MFLLPAHARHSPRRPSGVPPASWSKTSVSPAILTSSSGTVSAVARPSTASRSPSLTSVRICPLCSQRSMPMRCPTRANAAEPCTPATNQQPVGRSYSTTKNRFPRSMAADLDRSFSGSGASTVFASGPSYKPPKSPYSSLGETFITVRVQSPSPHPGGSSPAIQKVERCESGCVENTTRLWLSLQLGSLKVESV